MLRQGIRETSTIQKYPIGYRFAEKGGIGDRVFRYCKTDLALPLPNWGAANGDTLHEQNTAVVASEGAQDITIVLAVAAKDQFKDGYINIHTAPIQVCLKVKGNDASDGTNTVIHLEEPLLADVALATFTDIHENKYHSVVPMDSGGFQSVVVVPLVAVPVDNYFWGQTWGDIICAAGFGAGIGLAAHERVVYFQHDGSIGLASDLSTNHQYAGFLLPTTSIAGEDIFFMLQLAP